MLNISNLNSRGYRVEADQDHSKRLSKIKLNANKNSHQPIPRTHRLNKKVNKKNNRNLHPKVMT